MGNWDMVSLGLHNMNGALDEDYRLPISNKEWTIQADGYIVWECNSCTVPSTKTWNKGKDNERIEEIEIPKTWKRAEIQVFDEHSSQIVLMLSGEVSRKMWLCPKCKVVQSVNSVRAKLMRHAEPHFRGCIYAEPERPLTGLRRRRGSYPRLMRNWSKLYSMELEHQLALYRLEYIKQTGDDMEFAFQDKGGD